MADFQQNDLWQHFIGRPPELEGDVALSVEGGRDRQALLRFEYPGGSLELRGQWLAVPYPSGLRRFVAANPDLQIAVVERIPRGLEAAAKQEGIAYLDIRGNGRIVGPGFVYVMNRFPAPPRSLRGGDLPDAPASDVPQPPRSPGVSKSRVSPFAPKASRIVRAMLAAPKAPRRLSDLAVEVDVDPGNAHRVLASLVEAGLGERDEDLYLLSDPGSLLEAWVERGSRSGRDRLRLPVEGDLEDAARRVIEELPGAAVVSGELAAELLAPHLHAGSALIHVSAPDAWSALDRLASEWSPPLRASGRIEFQLSDEGVAQFGSVASGLPLASAPQVYVDLARNMGRGREAAEHLRREILGY